MNSNLVVLDPWIDEQQQQQPINDNSTILTTPDPSLLDQELVAGIQAEHSVDHTPPKDVLNELDPLAHQEEKEAREAWANAESHPPQPQLRPPTPPTPPSASPPDSPPPTASTFTSFAAFARAFSIPSLPRGRPLSIDVARQVPSPATLSSFASQQQQPPKSTLPEETVTPTSSSRNRSREIADSVASNAVDGDQRKDNVDVPFDFQKFLDQMKTKNAEPIAKYLKSFLSNFAKRTFTTNDQVKIISDFLHFIAGQMRSTDIWKNASDAEFDNAMEGMEKLVMNRLYDFTFMPQVARAFPPRPVTADDLERDRVLTQRIALFGWIEEKHLDIPEEEGSKGFLMFAQQELLKVNHYKAPRDKLICILNCCKVIFGLIRHLKKEESADAFLPILIFVVLKANPDNLLSNVEFINRFRNPVKLQSEAGYYLSSLMGAVSFIETMDHTSLSSISQEDFERNVEEAIQALPPSDPESPILSRSEPTTPRRTLGQPQPPASPHAGEESAQPLSISSPSPAQTLSEDARRLLQKTGDTISKPLNAIGRIFSEALDGAESKLTYLPGPFAPFELGKEQRVDQPGRERDGTPTRAGSVQGQLPLFSPGQDPQTPVSGPPNSAPLQTPYKPRVRRVPSPSFFQSSPGSPGYGPDESPTRQGMTYAQATLSPVHPRLHAVGSGTEPGSVSRTPTPNLDIASMQAAIDSAHEQAATATRETLVQIFPGVDREVVDWVLEANDGDLGKSIEALLEMSSGS